MCCCRPIRSPFVPLFGVLKKQIRFSSGVGQLLFGLRYYMRQFVCQALDCTRFGLLSTATLSQYKRPADPAHNEDIQELLMGFKKGVYDKQLSAFFLLDTFQGTNMIAMDAFIKSTLKLRKCRDVPKLLREITQWEPLWDEVIKPILTKGAVDEEPVPEPVKELKTHSHENLVREVEHKLFKSDACNAVTSGPKIVDSYCTFNNKYKALYYGGVADEGEKKMAPKGEEETATKGGEQKATKDNAVGAASSSSSSSSSSPDAAQKKQKQRNLRVVIIASPPWGVTKQKHDIKLNNTQIEVGPYHTTQHNDYIHCAFATNNPAHHDKNHSTTHRDSRRCRGSSQS